MSDEDVLDVDTWKCQVALLSVRYVSRIDIYIFDIYSLNLHGTEGNVALQPRFGFVS